MRKMRRNRGLWTLSATVLGMCVAASVASALPQDVTTEQGGSVVIYPKVIWDGSRDTIIQIANTGNMPVSVHCYYVDSGTPGTWVETDFYLYLTRQQPTHWVVSKGRRVGWDDFESDGAGFDPGLVPPVREGFAGELKCVQVDANEAPLRANQLKGEAILRYANGDVSKYNAIALRGNPDAAANANPYQLDLNWTAANPGGQYSVCPDTLVLAHAADGAPEVQGTTTHTELTLAPCFEDFENQLPGITTVGFNVWNEFENRFSGSFTVDCWLNKDLTALPQFGQKTALTFATLGTMGANTELQAVHAVGAQPQHAGVMGVAEQRYHYDPAFTVGAAANGDATGHAAWNLAGFGTRPITNPSVDQFILSQP